jgi:RHS repeat-associated protein
MNAKKKSIGSNVLQNADVVSQRLRRSMRNDAAVIRAAGVKHSASNGRRSKQPRAHAPMRFQGRPVFPAWLLTLVIICQASVAPFANAEGGRGKAVTTSQAGDTLTIYGPRHFERLAGSPTTVNDQFSLPPDAVAPFNVIVQNGAPDGSGRVSSATIKLNGADLFTQRDFNQSVPSLIKTVPLHATNNIEVRLTSAVGSFLTITFTTSRSSLQTVEPTRAVQGRSLEVTLRGQNTQWAAGRTRASFGAETSVGGAPAGEPGPVTVINPVTATAQVSVQPAASLGPRNVQVSTTIPNDAREEVEVLTGGFAVGAITPPGSSSSSVMTIAGIPGSPGFADGPASQAQFRDLAGISVGPDGSIYVADAGNNRVRVIRSQPDSAGNQILNVSTVAGDGAAGFADGPAGGARFNNPQGVAVDANGILYVADTSNNRIRQITPDGAVTTLAGDGLPGLVNGPGAQARFNAPRGIAVDNSGNIYVVDTGNSALRSISPNGTVATVAGDGTIGSNDSPDARFDGLMGLAIDGATLYAYLADTGNHRIRRLDSRGTVITVAGADRGFADGSAAQSRFAEPSGIAIDAAGKIVVADGANSLIRAVDPTLSAGGSPQAVTTLAGTGERGLTDGAGNVARLFTPRGVAITMSSAIIVADTGNHVLRKILLPPVITSITPSRARASETMTISGERFDGRSPDRNIVRFTRSAQAGGGQTVARVVTATRTQLTVIIPQDAGTGPVTVQTEGGVATAPTNFDLAAVAPVISDFNPKSGTVGSVVTLTGMALKADTGPTVVTFAGGGNTRLQALVTLVSATEVRAVVPNGAVTGIIELTNALGRAATGTAFTVEPGQQDYQITVAPSSTTAVQRGNATYVIFLTSPLATFTQLVSLSATGLPAGVSATFGPPQITAGASSTLTLRLSDADLSPGTYSFNIRGSGLVNGSELVRTVPVTLNVISGDQTTLSGRVLSTENEPIMGATVSLDGRTVTTDAAGAFLLSGVTAGVDRPLMVDGRTASAPNRTYPVIIEPATIVAGQANVVPYTFYLPAIDTQFEVDVVPRQNTEVTNPRVPGLKMIIPSGANLRNRDGSPVARASITPLPVDRTPAPLPENVATSMVYTSQPGGALTDIPIPVTYPNLAGINPGTRAELYAFNHDTVKWYVYGFGRVSPDGRTIEPEVDPATGRQYGLRDFSWHFPFAPPIVNPSPPDSCPSARTGNTVDLATGSKIETMTDISFRGARGGLELTRTYTSDLAAACSACPFGRGTTHNYAIQLTGTFQTGGSGRVVFPDEVSGRLFNYARVAADGALVFASTATVSQLGDVVRRLRDGTLEYRYADGRLMKFDSGGRLTAMLDRNGNTTTLTYTGANLTRITDPVGRAIALGYDAENRIVSATDPAGRVWRYTYEGTPGVSGNPGLTTVTDAAGNVMRYEYTTGGRLSKVIDNRGVVAKRLTYDVNGRVVEQKFADGGTETYDYSLSGLTVTAATMTDSLGRTETKRFNATGYVISTVDSLGQSSRIERDSTTNLPKITGGPCGCPEDTRQFDERGNTTVMIDRMGQAIRMEYEPAFNQISKVTDALGRVTTLRYDIHGNLISSTDALNQTTSYTYDAFGELTGITDPLGHATRIEYDAQGNLVATTDALNNQTRYEYDGLGFLTATTDPMGRRATLQYDALNRPITSVDLAGAVTRFTYDENGNQTSVTDALARRWNSAYDIKNRLVSEVDPSGRVTRMQYNTDDDLISITSPSGRVTNYDYDLRGQRTLITDPLGGVIKFIYDSRNNLTALVDERGKTTAFTYDELYRPISSTDPLGRIARASYDAAGNVIETVDRLDRRMGVTYDALNRRTRIVYADATITVSYDAASRITQINDTQSGSIQWAYDDADRLLSETTQSGVVNYSYDAAGERTSMAVADRIPVNYGYDSAGRLRTISQGADVFTYSYDTVSRRAGLQRPNGITTTYTYDNVDRLARLLHATTQGQVIEDLRYGYNLDDEIQSLDSIGSAHALPAAKEITAADAANRIASYGASNLSFDAAGQLRSKITAVGPTNYEWDARGRLTRATMPDGQSISYVYDALGRRTGRSSGAVSTAFLYDGGDVVLDRVSGGGVVEYINGANIDEKLRQTGGGPGSLYFIQDHLSTTVALTGATGNLVERERYEPFGESAGSDLTRYGFTGRERDAHTGLLFYRARWYDAQQGRFISEDPVGFASGDTNLYAYVDNEPINNEDPLGLARRGGGPYHPPEGVSTSCTQGDSCGSLQGKMWALMRMIKSHQGWDRVMPKPRGGGRHALEIAELWRAWAKCQALYESKCNNKPCPPQKRPYPVPVPVPVPSTNKAVDKAVKVTAGIGAAYIAYRGLRLLPSLAPPLWWTIPANLAVP